MIRNYSQELYSDIMIRNYRQELYSDIIIPQERNSRGAFFTKAPLFCSQRSTFHNIVQAVKDPESNHSGL